MPEEVTITSTTPAAQLPQPGLPMTSVGSASLLRALIQIPIVAGALTIGLYIVLALQTGAWQLLAEAAFIAIGIVLVLQASRLIKRGRFKAAGYIIMLGFAVAYGGAELVLLGLTPHIVIGGMLLIVLTGSMLLPGQWKKTLTAVALYLAYLWLAERITFLPRYDTSDLLILNVAIAGATAALGLIIFWLFTRTYASYALRTKLIIAFLIVSLVSASAVALYADRAIRAALQNQASIELSDVARQQGTIIGDLLAKEVELLRAASLSDLIQEQAAASNASYQGTSAEIQTELLKLDNDWISAVDKGNDNHPLIRAKLDNPIAEYLRRYRTIYPENAEVFVTDRYGALLGATNRTSDYYQADEDWWQAAYNNGQGAIYYAQPDYDSSSGTFSQNIAVPLYDRDRKNVIGVMRSTINLAAIITLLNKVQVGQTGHIDLLLPGQDGHNDAFLRAQGTQEADTATLAGLPASAVGVTQIDWEGTPSFVAAAPVRATNPDLEAAIDQLKWRITAQQTSAEVLAPIDIQAGAVLIVMIFVAVIATGASVWLSLILARPIVRLTATAQKVAAGDLTAQATVETRDEIGTLAVSFNNMTSQLRNIVGSLEDRVQARTEQLRASAAVGQAAASVLERGHLLREVVNLITERFGFHYAAVFTLDDTDRYAVLREGTGEAGQMLKEQGHQLEVGGQSMVGFVTAQRRARIALDVGEEAVRFANPLLPETRSEIALPLIAGNRVLGALDVQSTQEAAFDEASATVLQSMADQIAVALNNAEQFKQIEQQAKLQSTLNQFTRGLFAASTTEELYRMLATELVNLVPHDRLSLTLAQTDSTTLREYPLQAKADLVLTEGPVWSMTNTLSGRACATRQPVISARLEQDALLHDAAQLELAGFQSALSLPLVVGERVLGTLNFASRKPGAFSPSGSAQLEQLAGQIAIALENQRLAQAQQASLREMETLTRQLTGQAWARRRQRQTMESVQYVRSGMDTDLPPSTPEMQAAMEQGAPVARSSSDTPDHASLYEAALAVPVVLRGEVLGALQVGEMSAARGWTEDDLTFMQAVADQVALALDNARLIEETERRADRGRLVAEISSRMFAANDLETIVKIAGEELGRVLRVKQTTIKVRSELTEAAQPGNGQTPDQHA